MSGYQLDQLTRDFINRYQGDLPLVQKPYAKMARQLGVDEQQLMERLGELLRTGVLSRFGPSFDAVAMGGGLTLAAMSVPEDRYEAVSDQVNQLQEIAHNYRRDHVLNMWFVIATERPENIADVINAIESATGLPVYNFPKLREFYLGLWLMLDAQDHISTKSIPSNEYQDKSQLDELDRRLIHQTQDGLPLVVEPFEELAGLVDSDADTVMQRLKAMLETGVIRRIGAIPNHYRLGLKGNGMSVWNVPDERLEEFGKMMGQLEFVSHCYERPRHLPLWPYNLFAMVHGKDRQEVCEKITQIEAMLGDDCPPHEVLFSSGILKKTGLRLAA